MFDQNDWRFAVRLLRSPHRRDLAAWLESRLRADYLMSKPSPWLSLPAIRWLRVYLRQRRGARVFEYGGGGSTLFWLQQGCKCVSVEHDDRWYAELRARIPAGADLDLRGVAPAAAAAMTHDPADPERYQSLTSARLDFRDYVRQIDEFPDGHFDVVLIDGRARPSCVAHAHAKVRAGGVLVLDNADRPHYAASAAKFLSAFRQVILVGALPTLPQLNRTDIFVRPA